MLRIHAIQKGKRFVHFDGYCFQPTFLHKSLQMQYGITLINTPNIILKDIFFTLYIYMG